MTNTVTRASTNVHSHSRSTAHVANRLVESAIRLAMAHGVCEANWADRLDVLERGPRTWLLLGQLKKLMVEIYDRTELVAKYEFPIEQSGAPRTSKEVFTDSIADLEARVKQIAATTKATHYRIVCDCGENWEPVPGWSACKRASDSHLKKSVFSDKIIETQFSRVESHIFTKGDIGHERGVSDPK